MAAPTPLAGLRVLDLTQNLAGPYATQILADFGADVIKVEPPGGDPARAWGPPFVDGDSPLFLCANRNKRSIILDLQNATGREALRRLAESAHVFVQAFRSGVIEEMGFGYDAIQAIRPDVIYVSVTAFGTEGPLSEQPGYDPLMQAYAGLMSVTGHPGGAPTRVGTSLVDMGTGQWAAMAVMAELAGRDWRNTGGGHDEPPVHITTSLLDTALAWMAYHLQGHLGAGHLPGPGGSGLGMIAPYQAFPSADGHLMIAAANDGLFRRLCRALDLPDLAADPRFATNADRVAHRAELVTALGERTRRETTADIVARLRQAAVPSAPIQDVAQVARDDQVAASGMLRPMQDQRTGLVDIATPIRWDGERPAAGAAPPRAGEHTAEIMREVGLEDGESE